MMTNKINVEKVEDVLQDALRKLDILQKEKKDIIARYKVVEYEEKKQIEKEMKESEAKFQKLAENMKLLNEKIKKIMK